MKTNIRNKTKGPWPVNHTKEQRWTVATGDGEGETAAKALMEGESHAAPGEAPLFSKMPVSESDSGSGERHR